MTICKKAQPFIFSTFLLFLTALAAHGADATFSWNANTEPTLSGYNIHYGTSSRNYSSVIDVGLPAVVDGWVVHSVDGLLAGTTYYFAATAYSATEESDYSAEVVYTVPGTAAPAPPVASNIALQGSEDTLLSGQLDASNPDGSALSFTVVSQPDHGLVTVEEDTGFFTYNPAANYTGNDTFSYTASNSGGISNLATATIFIASVNDAPVANNTSFAVDEDSSYSGTLAATDIDGDDLVFSILAQGSKGIATINQNGAFTYTPHQDISGSDSFTFRVNDGSSVSNAATVNVTITPVNNAPVAHDSSFTIDQNITYSGQLAAIDEDGDSLSFSLAGGPEQGNILIATNGSYTYTPNPDASGADLFTFSATDGNAVSNMGTVNILITEAADATGSASATFSWEASTEPVSGYKIHYGTSSRNYNVVIDVGLPTAVNGEIVATVEGLLEGQTYYFSATAYSAIEESDYSAEVVYTVPGTATSQPPIASDLSLQGSEDTLLSGQLEASSAEGTSLQFTIVSQPSHGTLTVEDTTGSFSYTPISHYSGNDAFSYTASNSAGVSNTATVNLTILAVNVSPVAVNASITVDENSSHSGQLSASDEDGDPLSFLMLTAPAKGDLSIAADGTFTYIPEADATGTDSFTFRASDGSLESNTATVDIFINELPVVEELPNDFAFEVGELQVTSQWQSVSFETTFVNPSVVAKAGTMNDADPSTIRIRNLTSTGFDIRIQEWDYLDGAHPAETITFMAMEQGQHQIADNMQAIAGCSNVSDLYNFHQIYFTNPLPTTPVVFASIVTENEQDAVTLRIKDIGADGFALALQEQENNDGTHAVETACFIAIEEGTGMVDNLMIEVAATENTLTDTPTSIPFAQLFPVKPFTLADMQSANGGDTAVLGLNNLSATAAGLAVVEETSSDSEVRHIAETGGYVAIAPYDAVPPPLSLSFEVGEITVDSIPVRVNFTSPFNQPVIIANTITRNDPTPRVIRISDVDAEGFTIQIQAYDYLENSHGMETISYLVMEKGNYTLDDGTQIEAGSFDTNATRFAAQSFVRQLDVAPVIFTSIITMNDPEAVIGRVQNIATTGFEYQLQEQQANTKVHGQETVAYLAWTPGSGKTNGIHFQVGNTEDAVSHNTFAINFNQNFSALPFQFAGMQTTDGADVALVKIIQAAPAGMDIMIEEETSKDAETNHTKEVAGFLALLPE